MRYGAMDSGGGAAASTSVWPETPFVKSTFGRVRQERVSAGGIDAGQQASQPGANRVVLRRQTVDPAGSIAARQVEPFVQQGAQ